jgi:hypothetical protein
MDCISLCSGALECCESISEEIVAGGSGALEMSLHLHIMKKAS